MRIGERVYHLSLGNGTILAVYPKGGRSGAEVDFAFMTEWVPLSELLRRTGPDSNTIQTGSSRPKSKATEKPLPEPKTTKPRTQAEIGEKSRTLEPLPADVVTARRGVLALKLGQVLEEQVIQLSTGIDIARASLEQAISQALNRQSRSILIKGAWGSGKTHLLTTLSAIAATNGMTISSLILDGDGISLSDPMSLMEAFLTALRYPGEHAPCGLSQRLKQLRLSEARHELRHRGSGRIASAICGLPAAAFDEPEVVQVLEDYFTLSVSATQANSKLASLGWRTLGVPSLRVNTVEERPNRFCELLREWTEFVVLTGAKGLVLIIDEVDVDYARSVWDAELRRRRRWLLRALSERMANLPLVVAFGSAPSGEVEEEHDPVRDLKRHLGANVLEIEAPKPDYDQICQLAQRISSLYADAYPSRINKLNRDELMSALTAFARRHLKEISPVPRQFVRGTLERLDVMAGA